MKYKKLENYKDDKFRRITGIKRETFEKMTEILKAAEEKFRIVAERCRNRRRRFGLRFNLIAGSCNFENAI